jgi:hypothetical protein
MDFTVWWYALASVLILVGLAGTVLPALPGLPLVFTGMLLAAWAGDFQQIGVWTLVALGVLTVLSLAVDIAATALGAKKVGASRHAMIGATLGTFGGLFFSLPGLIVGPFVGAVAGELAHQRSLKKDELAIAAKVGMGTWLGLALGAATKLAIAFTMLGVFALALIL